MIDAPHYSAAGARHTAAFTLPVDPFDGEVNDAVLHQAVTSHLANQRQGTAKTKTRSFVSGGNQKPWKQKGTGRARQGSSRAPHWPGGGTVFGPIPRDYRAQVNRKVRRIARRSALNARAREGAVHVIDPFTLERPRTAAIVALVAKLALDGGRTLILTDGAKPQVYRSGRNLQRVDVLPFSDATAYDILRATALVIESSALSAASQSDSPPSAPPSAEPRPKRARAPRKSAATASAASKTASKAASKPAPKRSRKKASE